MSPFLVALFFAAPALIQITGVLLVKRRPAWTRIVRSRWSLLEGGAV